MTPKETAYQAIAALVEKFGSQPENYKVSTYNETLTRRDFIDPFFEALGWDINNKAGAWEAYREVIHEDRLKIDGVSKAPDYSFRLLGGHRLFFVEAKKPSVHIKDDTAPAYQVRLYGWNAKLAISVVTDFEEFAIYDCSKKPKKTDKTSTARLNYFTYKDYLTQFDFLWDTFSREQVIKGGLIKFQRAEKKGTATVDKEFLNSLDQWRVLLAANISKNNPEVNEDDLNYAVQQTIDRIIFLRIAEDRGLEPYGQLKSATKHDNFYKDLFLQFNQADAKYNSGLFHFRKEKDNPNPEDKITGSLVIDNKTIKAIIHSLYPPESDFLFDVLPVEILGSAYEQFLGKQIVVGKTGKATIEEKPEVRKAGGVYYTPQYIVEYIVQHTVGKLTEGKTPAQVSKLKIVDPACGSGSFLLGAYQFLLNWHMEYYKANGADPKKKNAPINAAGGLTTAEKKRILVNNLYGVDLDKNAVEVTKLSLLLKCMEGETMQTVNDQMKLLHERVLPSLENNIKCGNSLIDLDYYEGSLDFGEEKKIKPFSWEQNFPAVFKQGGFDVVVGNPPYGARLNENELSYYRANFDTANLRVESYLMFFEKGITILKSGGLLGFIVPDTVLNLGFTKSLRGYLFKNSKLQEVVGLPSNVFNSATVDTIIILTEKKEKINTYHNGAVSVKLFGKKNAISSIENPYKNFQANIKDWYKSDAFNLQSEKSELELLKKIERERKKIENIGQMFSGIKCYEVGKGQPAQTNQIRDEKPFTSNKKIDLSWSPFYDGKHISKYQILWSDNNWIKYGKWLAAPRDSTNFEGEKILIRKIIGRTLLASYVPTTSYCNTLLFVLKLTDTNYSYKSILAILNSNLIGWYFRNKFQISNDDTFPQIMIRDILKFPLPNISSEKKVSLDGQTSQILSLYKELQEVSNSRKSEQLESRIAYTDDKINKLVYELYGLTDEEIKIVEGE